MIGVLLVNLGTPDSPSPKDVRRYLIEFLTDERVIDLPWLKRQFLVRWVIVPKRYQNSARSYSEIWTKEGSPLMIHGNRVKKALQDELGGDFIVELAMRYQNPSIAVGLESLRKQNLDQLIIIPLFPQYASATTGSIYQKVMEIIKKWQIVPEITFVNNFYDHPAFIEAFAHQAAKYPPEDYDHILFSFHGLPEKQLQKADCNNWCLQNSECCQTICDENRSCYAAQCYATARAIAQKCGIKEYTVCFQSRLGKDPWIKPYTSEVIQNGAKRILVFSPAFVCDCLETIHEIGIELVQEFTQAGGEHFDLVEGLNDSPQWIETLKQLVLERSMPLTTARAPSTKDHPQLAI